MEKIKQYFALLPVAVIIAHAYLDFTAQVTLPLFAVACCIAIRFHYKNKDPRMSKAFTQMNLVLVLFMIGYAIYNFDHYVINTDMMVIFFIALMTIVEEVKPPVKDE